MMKHEQWIPSPEHRPWLMAGPCSAESEEQILAVARDLAATGRVSALRAGVWKPRTRPGAFEGVGPEAFEWLNKARALYGLPYAVEVGNPQHVEVALKQGADLLWLGARTTVNPFYVQEIAEALRGSQVPVLVKNPLHPDLGLWLGALERLQGVHAGPLAAVLRGFYSADAQPFRNEPRWEMAFELRTRWPELPILCDPSHIAGNRSLLAEVAQTAMDLQLNGLMVEVHPQPDVAKSDAAQQITPDAFVQLINGLVIRDEAVDNPLLMSAIHGIRSTIDELDHQMIDLLAHRMSLVGNLADLKKENGMTIFQLRRFFDILADRDKFADNLNINKQFIYELFQIIHKYSVAYQIERKNFETTDVLKKK
jgi:chorismate mutase